MNKGGGVMLLALLALPAGMAIADDGPATTSICFVTYASKVLDLKVEGEARVYIDDANPTPLFGNFPRIIATGLQPGKEHHLTVKRNDEVWLSMPIRLRKNVTMLDLWRSPGYWHLEPSPSGRCDSSILQEGSH